MKHMLPLRDQLPSRRTPYVTYALIALNVLVYLWQKARPPGEEMALVMDHGVVPAHFLADPVGQLSTILSSMFMHSPGSLWHLGGNMLFLWIFGDNVEDALGPRRFVGFYLLGGLVASTAQIMVDPASLVPMVGASGAIAAVLAAYGSLYPWAPVTILNPIMPLWLFGLITFQLPAWLVILEFFVMNLFSGVLSIGSSGGGVAFFAHLGGFLAGLVLVRMLFKPSRRSSPRWKGLRRSPTRDALHRRRPPRRRLDPRVADDPWLGPR